MAGPIRIAILSNGRAARADISRTAGSLGLLGKSASRATKLVGGIFALSALKSASLAVGKVGASYVDSLNKIQALTGSTDAQMGRLAKRVESQSSEYARFGQTTGDAASGMVELAKSGLSAQKALGAIRGTMLLAKAGELEVADASELVANTLNTFNLRAAKATSIANSLANAANISSADVRDVAESFKYVAPLAAKANISVDQTNALLAELANSGIKASQAGTTLRGMLVALQAPSTAGGIWLKDLGVKVYDAAGKTRDFGAILEDLRKGLARVSEEDANFALKSIFGRNSITGAQVLIKGGAKALDEYTRGVKRAGAAEKLAASASKGLAGTLLSVKANVVSTVQELYRRYSPALDARIQSATDYVAKNKDELIETASAIGRRLGPALESLAGLTGDVAVALKDTAVPLAKDLLPALETTADIAQDAADFLGDLPGPVKEIGVQAGIAALILPRLTAGVTSVTSSVVLNIARLQQWRAEMTYSVTRAQQTAAMMERLGAAAKAAAGIAGMVALTQSTQQTNETLSKLLTLVGGAATGFAVGGPVGAVLGLAAGGAFIKLRNQVDGASQSFKEGYGEAGQYAATLDRVSGAITRVTRAEAAKQLQDKGAFGLANQLGVSYRDLTGAVLGNEGALARVTRAITKQSGVSNITVDSLGNITVTQSQLAGQAAELAGILGIETEALDDQRRKTRELSLASGDLSHALKGIDKQARRTIVSRIETKGWPESERQIARVVRGLSGVQSRKQIRTVLKAVGFEGTRKQIDAVRTQIERLRTAKPDLSPALRSVQQFSLQAKRRAIEGGNGVSEGVERGPRRARADLSGYNASLRSGLATSKRWATEGGTQVGANLKSGIFAGFAGTAAALASEAASAVRQAVAAAKQAGEIHSPSRKMDREVGKPLGQGLINGFLRQVTKGSDGIKQAIDRLQQLISSRLDGKKQADRRKALLKSLKAESAALRENGKLQDAVAKKLERARDRYKTLIETSREFASSVKAGFQSYGSIVGLGTTGGGTAITGPALLSQLAARAGIAEQLVAIINQLKDKLNKTSLKQLLDQAAQGDLEGALATAQAITAGGPAALAQINALTAQITKAGESLGLSTAQSLYGAGIRAAEAVVKGLERRQKRLDRVADRLADQIIKRLQERFGVGKTSQPPTATGRVAARDTYASRTPAYDAYMSARQTTVPAPVTNTYQITVNVAPGGDLVQAGRQMVKAIDAYEKAGGRRQGKRP